MKNQKNIIDIFGSNEQTIKTRIFTFYYYLMKKPTFNVLLFSIFMFIETIQILSYAFSDRVIITLI